jgi:uncharacterized protein involved in response to NO
VKVFNRGSSARLAAVGSHISGTTTDCRSCSVDVKPKNFVAVAAAEPFRIFFPLGLLLGAIGVALWPLFVWHAIDFYPREAHLRLMIEGLMGSFIIGFLSTAGPRLLDVRPFAVRETGTLLVLQILSAALHLNQKRNFGDVSFLIMLILFLGFIADRARMRHDLPPPNFVLVLLGFVNAVVGILLISAARRVSNGALLDQLGSLLLNQGFVLFPILGVGAFFFSKLLGGARPERSDLHIGAALWRKRAGIAAMTDLVIWSSFALEALAWVRTASLVRGMTTLIYFAGQGHLLERPSGPNFLRSVFVSVRSC